MTILERIAKGSAIIFIATVIIAILEYAYQVAMAHFLSPETFALKKEISPLLVKVFSSEKKL